MSYRFFENKDCEYYPCHKGIDKLNCLFCYCPLYHLKNCPGEPQIKVKEGKNVRICTGCTFPHKEENYDRVVELIKNQKGKEN